MLPQRNPNETMEEYFTRTTIEAGGELIDGVWVIPPGSRSNSLYMAWVLAMYHKNISVRNQY